MTPIRAAAYVWVAVCVTLGAWALYDANHAVHGTADPILGTDGPQFAQWLEDQDD